MPEDLQRLARNLRNESCPRRVLDEALRRIAAETAPPSPHPYFPRAALAGSLLLCGLFVWWQLAGRNTGRQTQFVQQQPQTQAQARTQVARQAETALALIGTVLLDAGSHSQTVIYNHAISPL